MCRNVLLVGRAVPLIVGASVVLLPQLAVADPTLEGRLVAPDGTNNQSFGRYLSTDGDTLIVGAPGDRGATSNEGAAYIYTRVAGSWVLESKLIAPDAATNDLFGGSVAISGDTAAVGAAGDDDHGEQSGSVYIFVRDAGGWTLQQKITPDDGDQFDIFGLAIALAGDTLLVGAPNTLGIDPDFGAAYIYTRAGDAWTQQAKFTAFDESDDNQFGVSVALAGQTAVIGAIGAMHDGAFTGAAYVYVQVGGVWSDATKLVADDASGGASFGWEVKPSGDDLLIMAASDDIVALGSGAAYVFTRDGGAWTQQAKLTSTAPGALDSFGWSGEIVDDTVVIGAIGEDDGAPRAGAAYIFTRSGDVWTQQARLVTDAPEEDAFFGDSVEISGLTAFVSATGETGPGGIRQGAVYVYTIDAPNQPPVCPEGLVITLWPPDHRYSTLDLAVVAGVTDPDGDAVTITITGATQDEPVNGRADGNTSCDVVLLGGSLIDIRRERSSIGDGRVYRIAYLAEDASGAVCEGELEVHVPLKDGGLAVDSGADADATPCLPQADITGDGIVDAADYRLLLLEWGKSGLDAAGNGPDADIDRDGVVGESDLTLLLQSWGRVTLSRTTTAAI